MALTDNYRYQAEIVVSGREGSAGDIPLLPDWGPALEWSFHVAIRQGRLFTHAHPGPAVVEPAWDLHAGPPFVSGMKITLRDANGDPFSCEIPQTYFRRLVQKGSAKLVESGKLAAGTPFDYRLCAFPVPPEQAGNVSPVFDAEIEAVGAPLVIHEMPMAALLHVSERRGVEVWSEADCSAFVPAKILEEAISVAQQAGEDIEAGGILVGRLCRDPGSGELFTEVTAQIPARHTIAERCSLTLTGETWADVDAALDLRGADERIVGWFHSHPFFCRQCPPESRRVCPLGTPMFSESDQDVHRTVFGESYQLALLLSFLGEHRPQADMFGWRQGMINARGFYECSSVV